MIRPILLATAALTAGSAIHAQPTTTKLDAVATFPEIDKTTQTEDVRFKNAHDDRMTVAVRVAGAGPYQFLVDTGADRTAVSSALVSSLRLASGTHAELHSVTGVSTVTTAKVPSLQLTRASKAVEAAVLESANMGADGILGADMLRSQRVQFDFDAKTMSIVPSATPDFRDEPGTIVVQAYRKNGRLVVVDAVADGQSLTVVLDTGSQVTIGNSALRERLRGRSLVDGMQKVDLQSVTGATLSGDYMFVRDLSIGGIGLNNLAVVFTDAHTFHQLGLDKKPAILLGMNALRAFKKVSIDFANRKFRVLLPEHSALDLQLAAVKL
jgi:predicted aspartyl protease